MFTNESADILGICGATLAELGVSWRFSRRNTISVVDRVPAQVLTPVLGHSESLPRLTLSRDVFGVRLISANAVLT